ncbi:MAG: rhodanese-like domain-containing protein [Bacteroidota bacterium]
MKKSFRRLPWLLFTLFVVPFHFMACAQREVPNDRPSCSAQEFDQKVEDLLNFTVPVIGVDELYQQKNKPILLDARPQEEFVISHLEGARRIGFRDFNYEALVGIAKDEEIVVYCSVGYRSEKIGEKLQKMGYSNVKNLYGSLFEWANRGYPLVNAQGESTKEVHTYNARWSQWIQKEGLIKKW